MSGSAPTVREVRVDLPGRGTRVRLGAGVRDLLGAVLREVAPRARRAAVLIDERVEALWGRAAGLEAPGGLAVERFVLPAGEAAKEPDVLWRALDALLGLAREEPVVAVGGGAALDLAGLAAALAHRGHPWVALPTTVLAMADASVGGKVAVNHARGKNLVGTFHPPAEVLADLDLLRTLPARERASGLAEVWKAGVVGDAALLALLEHGAPTGTALLDALSRAVTVKARLVEQDERDLGPRRALNYGHTLGHVLERLPPGHDLGLLHGEAVALGMEAAARLAGARGLVDGAFRARQTAALAALGLPTALPAGVDPDLVLARLGGDKKRRPGATHTFVLPLAGGGVVVVEDAGEDEVRAALRG